MRHHLCSPSAAPLVCSPSAAPICGTTLSGGPLIRSLARIASKSSKALINAPGCATCASETWRSSEGFGLFLYRNDATVRRNCEKGRCLFRTVPRGRERRGTKMGKKAYFCPRLSQRDARGLGQTSRKRPFLFHTVPLALAQIGTNIAQWTSTKIRSGI
jgi:hypothetical protein